MSKANTTRPEKRFQFSLKQLLAWTTVAAVLCAVGAWVGAAISVNFILFIISLGLLYGSSRLAVYIIHHIPAKQIGARYTVGVFATSIVSTAFISTFLSFFYLVSLVQLASHKTPIATSFVLLHLAKVTWECIYTMGYLGSASSMLAVPVIYLLRLFKCLRVSELNPRYVIILLISAIAIAPIPPFIIMGSKSRFDGGFALLYLVSLVCTSCAFMLIMILVLEKDQRNAAMGRAEEFKP